MGFKLSKDAIIRKHERIMKNFKTELKKVIDENQLYREYVDYE